MSLGGPGRPQGEEEEGNEGRGLLSDSLVGSSCSNCSNWGSHYCIQRGRLCLLSESDDPVVSSQLGSAHFSFSLHFNPARNSALPSWEHKTRSV